MNTISDASVISKNVPHFRQASKAFRYGGSVMKVAMKFGEMVEC